MAPDLPECFVAACGGTLLSEELSTETSSFSMETTRELPFPLCSVSTRWHVAALQDAARALSHFTQLLLLPLRNTFAAVFLGSLTLSRATSCNRGSVPSAFYNQEEQSDTANEISTCRFLKQLTKTLRL